MSFLSKTNYSGIYKSWNFIPTHVLGRSGYFRYLGTKFALFYVYSSSFKSLVRISPLKNLTIKKTRDYRAPHIPSFISPCTCAVRNWKFHFFFNFRREIDGRVEKSSLMGNAPRVVTVELIYYLYTTFLIKILAHNTAGNIDYFKEV